MGPHAVATDAHMKLRSLSSRARWCGPVASIMLTACGGSGDGSAGDPTDAGGDVALDDVTAKDTATGLDAPLDTAASDAPGTDTAIAIDTGKSDGSCVDLGYHCSSSPCCAGTCDKTSSLCVSDPGGYCDGTKANPDAYCPWGYVCDKTANKCVKMTCVDEKWMGVCSSFPGLECCDPKTKCTKIKVGGSLSDTCCAPDGTTLPFADAYKCCSASVTSSGDAGEVQCIPRPPGP
jgi:hypothetical protein